MLRMQLHLSSSLRCLLLEFLDDFNHPRVKISDGHTRIGPRHTCIGIPEESLPLLVGIQGIVWLMIVHRFFILPGQFSDDAFDFVL
jgi:hypothetical protein